MILCYCDTLLFPVSCFKRTCYRPCSLDCATGGSPLLLQYKLLTLPSGIPANHNVVRLSAFSESGILQARTSFTILEQESVTGVIGRVFGIRDEAGRGIIFTLQALDTPGLVRLKVQATTISLQGRITYQSIFIIYISISAYPYWTSVPLDSWLCPLSGLWMPLTQQDNSPKHCALDALGLVNKLMYKIGCTWQVQ